MRLHSYVVARDVGFAPNPFHGVCTLATCKPKIRQHAEIGDWVVGTGSAEHGRKNHLVFVMKVDEILTFDEYWQDERFLSKRPNLQGSLKQAYGDNIYHRDCGTRKWCQEDSHHSFENGVLNEENLEQDTGTTENVLIGNLFSYWGGEGPEIPVEFRGEAFDIRAGRGHKNHFDKDDVDHFLSWYQSLDQYGYLGDPLDFMKTG
jgi:putative DNA base modification enzyme with NMAD domain